MVNIYTKNKIKSVICIGDLHGHFEQLTTLLTRYDLREVAIIVCGDIGLGFHKKTYYDNVLGKINKKSKARDVNFYLIRGNHDDPDYFDGNSICFSNIKAIPDYSVLSFETIDGRNLNILCVGGGISIDRQYRIAQFERDKANVFKTEPRKTYWENEEPIFSKEKLDNILANGVEINKVCTHTSPSFCYPTTKENITWALMSDKHLEEDLCREREVMDKIYDYLMEHNQPLTDWVYGHFHAHVKETVNGVNFILLDMYLEKYGSFDYVEI